jgi:hypothetical protein
LREHFLVRAQLSSSVEVRMPRTRLAACLSGAVIIAPAGCGTGSGGDNGGGNASGPIQIWEGYAKKLTEASAKQFGTAYVTPGSGCRSARGTWY